MIDCSPERWIAVSVADNPVLRGPIVAANSVPKSRRLQSRTFSIAVRYSYALALGAIGQALLTGHLLDRVPHWLVFVPLLGPWLIGHVISFCRVAPCSPGRFAQILIFAMAWYSVDTLVCELIWLLFPASRSQIYSAIIPHALCWGSALSFIVLVRGVRNAREYQANHPEVA